MMSYDVFDPDGKWQHEVQIRNEADPAHDGLIFLDDGRILLVKGLVLARLTASGSQGAVFDEEGQAGELEVLWAKVIEDNVRIRLPAARRFVRGDDGLDLEVVGQHLVHVEDAYRIAAQALGRHSQGVMLDLPDTAVRCKGRHGHRTRVEGG